LLRCLLDIFRRAKSKKQRFSPSSRNLPELWSAGPEHPRLDLLDNAPTEVLSELCDDYWNCLLVARTEFDKFIIPDFRVHRRAIEIIATRGTDALLWARKRLSHADYFAREDAAGLIHQWARAGQLGRSTEAVAVELLTLAVTPPKEDCKEAQAASAALLALSIIGGSACRAAVRHVLTSADWDDDENQWLCAEILAKAENKPFMDTENPIEAARSWLAANP